MRDMLNTDRIPQAGYLPLSVAAQWAGVSPRTLRRWISCGLPVYRSGPRSKVLLRPCEIDQFLTRQQASSPDLSAMIEETMADLTNNRN